MYAGLLLQLDGHGADQEGCAHTCHLLQTQSNPLAPPTAAVRTPPASVTVPSTCSNASAVGAMIARQAYPQTCTCKSDLWREVIELTPVDCDRMRYVPHGGSVLVTIHLRLPTIEADLHSARLLGINMSPLRWAAC